MITIQKTKLGFSVWQNYEKKIAFYTNESELLKSQYSHLLTNDVNMMYLNKIVNKG